MRQRLLVAILLAERHKSACRNSGSPRYRQIAAEKIGGAERDRTDDLMLAKHALSQLSYSPECIKVQPPEGAVALAQGHSSYPEEGGVDPKNGGPGKT